MACIGEGNGNPLQCYCLENPRDGGAWWAAVYVVAQSWTRLKQYSSSSSSNIQLWCTPFRIWIQSVVSCTVLTVASWPAYRFLRRQVRWSGIPISLRFFQFVVTHTVKGFSIVNEAEVDIFLEFPCFLYDPASVTIWSLVPLPFLNPACTSESSWVTYSWSLSWRILNINLLACEMSAIIQ